MIGHNGSGKSTLLRILAGVDAEPRGRALGGRRRPHRLPAPGAEPDARHGPRRTSRRPSGETHALLQRFDRLNEKLGEDLDADAMQAALDELQTVQEEIEARDAWELDRRVEQAGHALGCPDPDSDVATCLRRRAPPRRACEDPARAPGRAAPRRADQPPRRRRRPVARAPPRRLRRHRDRDHARPLLPRQRRGVDARDGPRTRHPLQGQLLRLPRAARRARVGRGAADEGQASGAAARARVDPPEPAGAHGEEQGAHQELRAPARTSRRSAATTGSRSTSPPARSSGTRC